MQPSKARAQAKREESKKTKTQEQRKKKLKKEIDALKFTLDMLKEQMYSSEGIINREGAYNEKEKKEILQDIKEERAEAEEKLEKKKKELEKLS